MEKTELIIADIDGTLTRSDGQISQYTKDVLKEMHDRGILFGIATGRMWDINMQNRIREWDLPVPVDMLIGLNGGQVYDRKTDTLLESYKLTEAMAKEILEMMDPLGLNPFFYLDGKQMALRLDDRVEASMRRNKQEVIVAGSLAEMWKHPIHKLMYRIPLERMPEAEDWVRRHQGKGWRSFKTQTTMIEFMDERINKGDALRQYAKLSGIPAAHMVAFGDMDNDIELLKSAGTGVCMANGSEETKKNADRVTEYTNDEDGMARFIRKYVLEETC